MEKSNIYQDQSQELSKLFEQAGSNSSIMCIPMDFAKKDRLEKNIKKFVYKILVLCISPIVHIGLIQAKHIFRIFHLFRPLKMKH